MQQNHSLNSKKSSNFRIILLLIAALFLSTTSNSYCQEPVLEKDSKQEIIAQELEAKQKLTQEKQILQNQQICLS